MTYSAPARFIFVLLSLCAALTLGACSKGEEGDSGDSNVASAAVNSASTSPVLPSMPAPNTAANTNLGNSSGNGSAVLKVAATTPEVFIDKAPPPLSPELAIKVVDIENNSLSKDEVSLTLVDDEDVNKDGIRDELDNYWEQLKLKSEQLRASHQVARAFQASIAQPKISREDAAPLADKVNSAVACIFARYPDNASKDSPALVMIEDIRRMTLNTKNRRLAYQEFLKAGGGYRITIDDTQCV